MTFRFASTFLVDAPPPQVVAVLRDVEQWPRWWPQIRHVEEISEGCGWLHIRSVLPITLHIKATREVESHDVLRAVLAGDLTGWSQFAVRPDGPASLISYTQDTALTKSGWTRAAPVLAPVLRANHGLMMRSGRAGLRRQCAAGRRDAH